MGAGHLFFVLHGAVQRTCGKFQLVPRNFFAENDFGIMLASVRMGSKSNQTWKCRMQMAVFWSLELSTRSFLCLLPEGATYGGADSGRQGGCAVAKLIVHSYALTIAGTKKRSPKT